MLWWYAGSLHCWAPLPMIDHNSFQWYCNQSYPIDESYLHHIIIVVVPLIPISIHTGTLSILRWLHQISLLIHEYYSNGTKSHHHHHLQAASSTSSSGSLTNIASFSQMVSFHRAIIGTSKLLFSKEGKCIQLVDLIPYISVHELVFFWDVMFSTHGDTVCWQRQANSCSYWFHSTYR